MPEINHVSGNGKRLLQLPGMHRPFRIELGAIVGLDGKCLHSNNSRLGWLEPVLFRTQRRLLFPGGAYPATILTGQI
jgi:hypothetical protein